MKSLINMTDTLKNKTLQFPFKEGDDYYEGYVFLIDILGFSHYVNEASFDDIKDIFKKFEDRVDDGNIHFTLKQEEYDKAVQGQKWTGGKSCKPAFTFFSDTIIMCIPDAALVKLPTGVFALSEEQRASCERNLILRQLALPAMEIQFSLLKQGFLSRGAIAFGKIYNQGSIWFGSPIVEAHKLETQEGNYAPRIILSDGVIKKLEVEEYFLNEPKGGGGILKDQEDGKIYCDYLAHPNASSFSDNFKEELRMCGHIIKTNIKLFSQNDKVRKKWEWALREYQKIPKGLL